MSHDNECRSGWSTKTEIEYIRRIGTQSQSTFAISTRRMLEGYLRGARRRKNWGQIDSKKAILVAEGLLWRINNRAAVSKSAHEARAM